MRLQLFRKFISGDMICHDVRPRITGWRRYIDAWGNEDPWEKGRTDTRYDLENLRHRSQWLDFNINAKTLTLVVSQNKNRLLIPAGTTLGRTHSPPGRF
jgi:lipopolysaccharide/colanic/teichoic acid biosynthesis glycosyltransferase